MSSNISTRTKKSKLIEPITLYCDYTVKAFKFVGTIFCGLTTMDVFVDNYTGTPYN